MKKRIFNLVIVDESGSMGCIQKSTVSGINETLQSIRHINNEQKETESLVTLITFSSNQVNKIYDCTEAEKAVDITAEQYCPNGCTPLFDAIGNGILSLQKQMAPVDSAFVTIITDGMENSSREFNYQAIRRLIEEKKKADWVFTFMGANIDVEATSKGLGIDTFAKFEQNEADSAAVWGELNRGRERVMTNFCLRTDGSRLKDIMAEEDSFFERNQGEKGKK